MIYLMENLINNLKWCRKWDNFFGKLIQSIWAFSSCLIAIHVSVQTYFTRSLICWLHKLWNWIFFSFYIFTLSVIFPFFFTWELFAIEDKKRVELKKKRKRGENSNKTVLPTLFGRKSKSIKLWKILSIILQYFCKYEI